jgi:glyoxylase-like metal-dependent hydrolase (beta-lactamase superfamily II)
MIMKKIIENVYFLGSSGCEVYLVDTESDDGLVLIDCGMSLRNIKNISNRGLDPKDIKHCIITHCHIDHTGACSDLREFNPQISFYAHELDAEPIEKKGRDQKTAASWYGVDYKPIKLDVKFNKDLEILKLGSYEFQIIHTPGHTPGSLSIVIEVGSKKVLFGQDIHGPFYSSFGSNLKDYQKSMKKLIDLEPDILCEGHFGIIQPADEVKKYIEEYMNQNKP